MTQTMKLAVLGAGGATGRQIVRQAMARRHDVRAIEPAWDDAPDWRSAPDLMTADVLTDDLAGVLGGCDAVISALGLSMAPGTAINPPPLYVEGARRIVDAMRRTGLRRLIVISATFVGDRNRGPIWFRAAAKIGLARVFDQMAEMEKVLRAADDIDWTAVRPGWLLGGPLTADYTVTPDVIPRTLIRTRHADLAHFMLECAESGAWSRQTPAIARREPARASAPDKLLRDILNL